IILSENDNLNSLTRIDSLLELVQTSERLKIKAVSKLELEIESKTDEFSSFCLQCLVLVDFRINNSIPLSISL
ncbi:13592_t:CDS:1, partial [Funneliformis caledonium]